MFTTVAAAWPDQLRLTDAGRVGRKLLMFASRPGPNILRANPGRFRRAITLLLLFFPPALAKAMDLKPVTLQAWGAYVHSAQMRMEAHLDGHCPFLWVEERPDLLERVRGGEVLAEAVDGNSPRSVPHGLIHDWIGAVFIPNVTLDAVMAVLNDYQHYDDFYRPRVAKASVFEQSPDEKKVRVLMVARAYSVTAAVDIDEDVHFQKVGSDRACSSTISTRVREIADFGKPSQHAYPEDHGPGYLWRTFFVTRLQERDHGVYVEMEMIGLSRSIPLLFRWLVQPLAEHLPRDILQGTLEDTRKAVNRETRSSASLSKSR